MNANLPRLVLIGLGTVAVTVSLCGSLRSAFETAGAGLDAAAYSLVEDCCNTRGACPPCPPPHG